MDKTPRGRPPRSKNVLHKLDTHEETEIENPMEEPEQEVSEVPEVKEVKQIQIEVKEKKPRSEAQQNAFTKMMNANKTKRQITISEQPKQLKEPKVPSPIQVPQDKHDEYLKMFSQLNERLNTFQPQKKEKKVKEKVQVPKTPKAKKIQKESSDEEEESDDEYVERYTQKAEKRFQAVKQIEQRLQQVRPKGRYDHLTLF